MSYDKEVAGGGVSNVDHQRSLSERRRAALEEVDNAAFSRFHVKACAVAGVGFFTDAYDSGLLEGGRFNRRVRS
jgi:PHS family inorganic phosphate transporter-like MFS transporter